MSGDSRKRQKKQERHTAKRKVKRHELVRAKHAGLAERLSAAASAPVLHSWVSTDLWTQGMGWACLSRVLPSGAVAFALFLIDRYCLGVKDAMVDIKGRFTYDSRIVRKMRSDFKSEEMSPAAVRKLVEGAVAYAEALGLHPHPDYQKARLLFGTIDPAESSDVFEFGKDGKPLFIAGPFDTPARCHHILKTLAAHLGPDGFHYLIPMGDPAELFPDELHQGSARVIGPGETGKIEEYRLDLSEFKDAEEEEP